MGKNNTNVVVITGNLTKDPSELRHTGAGTAVCDVRVACNKSYRGRNGVVEKVRYFDVVVWGAQAVAVSEHKRVGDPVTVTGELDYDEWKDKETEEPRSRVFVTAQQIEFLPRPKAEPAAEGSVAAQASSDEELLALERPELNERAAAAGVKEPDGYRTRQQVVAAIRELVEEDIPF